VARQLAWATSPSTISMSVSEALGQLRERITRLPAAEARPHGEIAVAVGRDGLTARELEVLRLVAEGLTDAQVAERLILSRRTVSTHLSSIYSKLQVSSRTAAVHAARDQGLLT
jgi:DNA-binding NarL/FixJ family response regulator